jgi:hypothetical protein
MPNPKPCDVEELMQWAAGELARKRPPQSTARQPFDVARGDRELVGRWTRPPGIASVAPGFSLAVGGRGGPRGDPPHADALIVEAAVARLAAISLPCPISEAELVAGIGFEVDVDGAVRAAFGNCANLALVHGRLCNRPLLRLEPPEISPRLAPNGRPGIWRRERWAEETFGDRAYSERDVEVAVRSLRKDLYPVGAYCVVDFEPRAQELVNERSEYVAWRASLEWLAADLRGELATRAPLTPRAAPRPWLGDLDSEPIADLFAPGADGVYSHADAARLAGVRQDGRRRAITGGGRIYSRRPIKPANTAGQA